MAISKTQLALQFVLIAVLSATATSCCMHHRLNASIPLADLHATDASNEFAQVFCSVLKEEPMKGWRGGACSRYLRPSAQAGPKPPVQITNQYRLLLVGGYMSQCIQGANATFMDSIHHLESASGHRRRCQRDSLRKEDDSLRVDDIHVDDPIDPEIDDANSAHIGADRQGRDEIQD